MRGGGAAEIGMWRKQVRAPASSHTNLELLALDKPTRPLLSSDWSESDSSIQPLYGKFHALCLPVGGASLANDAGRSECGVNKCGEASYLLRVELRVLKIAISSL